jgi:uncharacterized membrane protein YtjA (UPF0391 family)
MSIASPRSNVQAPPSGGRTQLVWQEDAMLKWALIFAIIAVVAGLLGFTGVAAGAASIAKILALVFLVLFLIALIAGSSLFRR